MNVLILAGERPGGDPLARSEGVANKTEIVIAGKSMLQHVLAAVAQLTPVPRVFISGNVAAADGVTLLPTASTPCTSVLHALQQISLPVLITTADHPLLTPELITHFLSQADAEDADVCVGLVKLEVVMAAYPQSRRTRLRFRGGNVSGANLFLLRNKNAMALIEFWRLVEANRKSPLRMLRVLGIGSLLRYALGLLQFSQVLAILQQRTGARIAPVMLRDPHAAIDVDKPEDLALVRSIFAARETQARDVI